MKTNCELCCREIEDDEVEFCPVCEQDGMCNDCLMDHECAREEEKSEETK